MQYWLHYFNCLASFGYDTCDLFCLQVYIVCGTTNIFVFFIDGYCFLVVYTSFCVFNSWHCTVLREINFWIQSLFDASPSFLFWLRCIEKTWTFSTNAMHQKGFDYQIPFHDTVTTVPNFISISQNGTAILHDCDASKGLRPTKSILWHVLIVAKLPKQRINSSQRCIPTNVSTRSCFWASSRSIASPSSCKWLREGTVWAIFCLVKASQIAIFAVPKTNCRFYKGHACIGCLVCYPSCSWPTHFLIPFSTHRIAPLAIQRNSLGCCFPR